MPLNTKEKKGIQQRIPISIKKIKREELESLIQNYKQNLTAHPKKTSLFDLSYHIKRIKDRDEHLGIVLEAINNKLDRLLNLVSTETDERDDLKEQTVYLKSDQIIFTHTDKLNPGDLVEIKLKLDYDRLTCFGEVQTAEQKDNITVVLAKLIWITDEDQDKFVEYLFKQEILTDKLKRGLGESR